MFSQFRAWFALLWALWYLILLSIHDMTLVQLLAAAPFIAPASLWVGGIGYAMHQGWTSASR